MRAAKWQSTRSPSEQQWESDLQAAQLLSEILAVDCKIPLETSFMLLSALQAVENFSHNDRQKTAKS